MAAQYIPSQESVFVAWIQNYSATLSANANSFGITNADAIALASMTSQYVAAYDAAVNPATRNAGTVALKNNYRTNVTARARQLAIIIQANPAITDQQKSDLGLLIRKTNKTPIPAPTSSPLMTFIGATPGQATLRFSDQNTPAKRGKPFGVNALGLWYQVGGTAPADTTGMTFAGLFTKNPLGFNLPANAPGQTVYYLSKWMTRTGAYGPASSLLQAKAI